MADLVEEQVVVSGLELALARPADPEALVDEGAFARDEFLPYWAELWPSSITLAHVVAELELGGVHVLELGCGLGLPSLVAAARGASVVALDWSAEAVELVERNGRSNGLTLRAVHAAWGDPAALRGEAFELILAADVLYEERNTPPLLAALGRLLLFGGEAIVVDPGRRHASGFPAAARSAGWVVEASAAPLLPRGSLLRLRRAAEPG